MAHGGTEFDVQPQIATAMISNIPTVPGRIPTLIFPKLIVLRPTAKCNYILLILLLLGSILENLWRGPA
jgi:hypothetical protein